MFSNEKFQAKYHIARTINYYDISTRLFSLCLSHSPFVVTLTAVSGGVSDLGVRFRFVIASVKWFLSLLVFEFFARRKYGFFFVTFELFNRIVTLSIVERASTSTNLLKIAFGTNNTKHLKSRYGMSD